MESSMAVSSSPSVCLPASTWLLNCAEAREGASITNVTWFRYSRGTPGTRDSCPLSSASCVATKNLRALVALGSGLFCSMNFISRSEAVSPLSSSSTWQKEVAKSTALFALSPTSLSSSKADRSTNNFTVSPCSIFCSRSRMSIFSLRAVKMKFPSRIILYGPTMPNTILYSLRFFLTTFARSTRIFASLSRTARSGAQNQPALATVTQGVQFWT
mmetsp:Transcript_13550/g.29895  ORF Transcript_13550/g.29895 Transcript_13550/m.29895 type:complete len:215 (+) Transcript_13550:368-1012(+)